MKKLLIIALVGLTSSITTSVMAEGDINAGKQKAMMCAACHGADGNSPTDAYPKIAGQGAKYIAKQLANFKSGERNNAIMAGMVASLSEQDMADLAAYFSSKKMAPGAVSEALLEAGEKLYRGGNKETGVPACMACHGPNGSGVPAAAWPKLSSQYSTYVEAQLYAFKKGERHNDPNSMMRDIAGKMSDDEIKAVSAYVFGLK
ncbi:MAG TPA: cytochrome c4 [Methylophaga aminisulfidivorans]|uniref:Cytochrome c4 n=2 Tax=root TaxID=1 RepID=A0A7C1W6E6_9GAMM|nr:cytochrome c4 [Methylophaga aminisulfidivorans]